MVNGEIGRGLYKAYKIVEQWEAFQWLYSGSTMNKRRCELHGQVEKWRTNDEQWTKERRTKDEQKTNKWRTNDEQMTNKWRTKDEQMTNNERRKGEGKLTLKQR